jgi:hypothetical protein
MTVIKNKLINFKQYIKGIYPEWIDNGERIAFAVEFDPHMFTREPKLFPEGTTTNGQWTEYGDALFEGSVVGANDTIPWFWLVPKKDITAYTDDIGEVELEDSEQRLMSLPSDEWNLLIDFVKQYIPIKLFWFTNVETGHSLDEYNALFKSEIEDGSLWSFSKEDMETGAIEPNPDMLYWEIDGRLYETICNPDNKRR